jgi:hypothetical protein
MNVGEVPAAAVWLLLATPVLLFRRPGDCEPAVGR